jgi:hypothetical protein
LIEVRIEPTGDSAEAESPEDACFAARTLLREAREQGCGRPTAAFIVDGVLVREGVRRLEV